MGDNELTIEQSIGVISGIATKKVTCVTKKPNSEAIKILPISFFSTFSLGTKHERSQKSDPAPNERIKNKAMGDSNRLAVKSLHTIMLMPKMAYAMKHAKCPNVFSRSIIMMSHL